MKPGEYGEAMIELDTADFEGELLRDFLVVTDAKDEEFQFLEMSFRVDVGTYASAEPDEIFLGNIGPQKVATRRVHITLNDPKLKDAFLGIDTTNPMVTGSVVAITPELLTLLVTVKPEGRLGGLSAAIRTRFDLKEYPEIVIPVMANVAGDIKITPSRILVPGKDRRLPMRRYIKVESVSGKEFSIGSIDGPDGLVITQEEDAQSESESRDEHIMVIDIPVSAEPTTNAEIVVKTSHPKEKVLFIPVHYAQ